MSNKKSSAQKFVDPENQTIRKKRRECLAELEQLKVRLSMCRKIYKELKHESNVLQHQLKVYDEILGEKGIISKDEFKFKKLDREVKKKKGKVNILR